MSFFRMDDRERCCGNCQHRIRELDGSFYCGNEESEGYGLETLYTDCCDDFEKREHNFDEV